MSDRLPPAFPERTPIDYTMPYPVFVPRDAYGPYCTVRTVSTTGEPVEAILLFTDLKLVQCYLAARGLPNTYEMLFDVGSLTALLRECYLAAPRGIPLSQAAIDWSPGQPTRSYPIPDLLCHIRGPG